MKKYNTVDLFKFLMSVCVIAIHTNPFMWCQNDYILSLYTSITECAVPYFFLASGFFLASKMKEPIHSSENLLIIKKYFFKILKLYLLWSALYLPLAIFDYVRSGKSILYCILIYIRNLLFIGDHYNSWMLWYLLSTIYAFVLISILYRFKFSPKKVAIVGLCIMLLSLGMDFMLDHKETMPAIIQSMCKLVEITISNTRILRGLFFLPFGMLLFFERPGKRVSLLMFISGFIMNYLLDDYLGFIALALCVTGLFVLTVSIQLKDSKIFLYLRKMSTSMYFIHMYVWTVFDFIVYRRKVFGITSFCVTLIGSIGISMIYLWISNKVDKARNDRLSRMS